MILEVRHLRIVDAICSEGSVTRAAERLFLTQPAVSHALADLERRLKVELFVREPRRMRPTEACNRLLRSARAVLDELQRVEHDLEQYSQGRVGVLRLTTQCYTCYHWLPALLREFSRLYPGIHLQLEPEATGRPLDALLAGRLDLAIVHSAPPHADLASEPLFRDELVAIVPRHSPLAEKPFLAPEDFADQTLVLHSAPEESAVVVDVLAPAGVRPRALALKLTEAVIASVSAGIGISAIARWAAEPELAAGTIAAVPITRQGLFRTWSAVFQRRAADDEALAALVRLLKRPALAAVEAVA